MTEPDAVTPLFDAARAVRQRAYAPYSRFRVGAALADETGRIHVGCNVENASYPVGLCAESAAIAAMVAAGGRRITAALVIGDGDAWCAPCGACRQRLAEFAPADAPVFVAGPEGMRRRFTVGELLPEAFGPENLAVADRGAPAP